MDRTKYTNDFYILKNQPEAITLPRQRDADSTTYFSTGKGFAPGSGYENQLIYFFINFVTRWQAPKGKMQRKILILVSMNQAKYFREPDDLQKLYL